MLEHKMKYPRNMKSFKWLRYHILACYYCIYILNMAKLTNETTEFSPVDDETEIPEFYPDDEEDELPDNTDDEKTERPEFSPVDKVTELPKFSLVDKETKLPEFAPVDEETELLDNDLEITCIVDLKLSKVIKCNSTDSTKILKLRNITRVDETTIKLYLSRRYLSDSIYECVSTENVTNSSSSTFREIYIIDRDKTEASNCTVHQLMVTEKPKDVLNFRCILYYLSAVRCLWDVQKNHEKTSYSIQYVPIISTETENPATSVYCEQMDLTTDKPVRCPNDIDETTNNCVWSQMTIPPYCYNPHLELNVSIISVNMFGETIQSFIFNPIKHRKPRRILRLNIQEVTSNSFTLNCSVENILNVPNGNWTVEVNSISVHTDYSKVLAMLPDKFYTYSRVIGMLSTNQPYFLIELLPIQRYNLKVRIKPLEAPAFDEYWSEYTRVETPPLPAVHVPETDVGLFRIIDASDVHSRYVYICWKPLAPSYEYGNFHYEIRRFSFDENGTKQLVADWFEVPMDKYYYAIFIVDSSANQFVIRSANSVSVAPHSSFINIPAANNTVEPIASFYIIKRRHLNCSFTFECIWQPPPTPSDVVDYSLFWTGIGPKETPDIIRYSKIQWIHLPANITRYLISIDFNKNYTNTPLNDRTSCCSISVNTKHSSSGQYDEMQVVHSISDEWHTQLFLQLKNKSAALKKKVQDRSKPLTFNGWKFSSTQFQKWMAKLHGSDI